MPPRLDDAAMQRVGKRGYPDGVTTPPSPRPARRPLRVFLVIIWAVLELASGVAILLGALTSALNGAGFETTFSNATPLFIACLVVNLAAGGCGILLGGRWWTAPLIAAPALIFGGSYLWEGAWVVTPLVASPLLVVLGIVCVLALPRRRTRDASAPASVDAS